MKKTPRIASKAMRKSGGVNALWLHNDLQKH